MRGKYEASREIVEHPGAVAILAINGREEVMLVKQHRQPFNEVLLEIPAGKLEPGEEPLVCAKRELLEETGVEANTWKDMGYFYPSPGFCNEVIYLFFALNLTAAKSPGSDPDENIDVMSVPLQEVLTMMEKGEIKDGKTLIALQKLCLTKKPT